MFADYHVHTAFSDDSDYPMERVIEDAIHMGMDELCFTDHVDYGIKHDWDSGDTIPYRDGKLLANVDYELYQDSIQQFKYLYGTQITLRMGIEFGMQVHTIPQYEKLFQRYPFDFVILSIHELEDKELWSQEFQTGKTQAEYNERYYKALLEIVTTYKNYSVLGHLDLINRYDKEGIYPFEKVRSVIKEILKVVIEDGKGIEVNTSSKRYGLDDLTPSRDILKMYYELGGRIVTIGSDSHDKEQLGYQIRETQKELLSLGFTTFCTFHRMKPQYHAIIGDSSQKQVSSHITIVN